jgi:hypothetical protein
MLSNATQEREHLHDVLTNPQERTQTTDATDTATRRRERENDGMTRKRDNVFIMCGDILFRIDT